MEQEDDIIKQIKKEQKEEENRIEKAKAKFERRRAFGIVFLVFSSIFLFYNLIVEGHVSRTQAIITLIGDVYSLYLLDIF